MLKSYRQKEKELISRVICQRESSQVLKDYVLTMEIPYKRETSSWLDS